MVATNSGYTSSPSDCEEVKDIRNEKQSNKRTLNVFKTSNNRVIVFERKTGKCFCGISAPTMDNLKVWLEENPTFEVVQQGSKQALAFEQLVNKMARMKSKVEKSDEEKKNIIIDGSNSNANETETKMEPKTGKEDVPEQDNPENSEDIEKVQQSKSEIQIMEEKHKCDEQEEEEKRKKKEIGREEVKRRKKTGEDNERRNKGGQTSKSLNLIPRNSSFSGKKEYRYGRSRIRVKRESRKAKSSSIRKKHKNGDRRSHISNGGRETEKDNAKVKLVIKELGHMIELITKSTSTENCGLVDKRLEVSAPNDYGITKEAKLDVINQVYSGLNMYAHDWKKHK